MAKQPQLHRGPEQHCGTYIAPITTDLAEDLHLFEPLESDDHYGEFMIEFVREMSEATMPKSLEASLSTAMETMSEVAESLERSQPEAQRAERMNRAERRARKAKKRKGQRF